MKTHARVFLRLLKRHAIRFGWIWLSLALALSLLTHRYHLAINRTQSLPYWLFVIDKTERALHVGDFAAFEPKRSSVGGFRLTFVKEIACAPGQELTVENRDIFCDGQFIARAKTHSLKGEPLEAIAPGILGEDQYFVRGTHKDSFDSRYARFGLVDECRIKGRAIPLF